jgi:PAS domain S-box-containing protein
MNLGVAPNRKCYEIFNNLGAVCPDCGVKRIFEQNASLDVHEYKTVNSKGETVWIELRVTPLKDEQGQVIAAVELAVPITERKKVEAKLRDSEERFRQVAENAQEWIWEVDVDGLYTYVSPVVESILGYKPDEIVGKKRFYDLFRSESREELKQAAFDAFVKKQAFRGFVNCNVHKDGRLVWLSTSGMPILNKEGNLVGYRGTDVDITEAKRSEEHRLVLERKVNDYSKHLKYLVDLRTVQLKEVNQQLVKAERLAAIGELAGMVGHDLRNPLAGIKNAAYFLKKKGTAISEAQYREMLETIDKSIDHSDKIINDLLEYARELHLEKTETTVPALVHAAIQMVHVPDRIQILNQIHDESLIAVDFDKVMRIFVNLVKNAIDAMHEKGTITISSRKTDAFVEVSFADTGTGIPEEILKKIFTPLFTTKAQGMGFGLAICKRIIDAHEGAITVKTGLNKGTTFTVALPLKPKTDKREKPQKCPSGK